jgi:hypothetical protein
LAGLTGELFIYELFQSFTTKLKWGGMIGVSLHWWFVNQWSLFFRPAFIVIPEGLASLSLKNDNNVTPFTQLELSVGLQMRF